MSDMTIPRHLIVRLTTRQNYHVVIPGEEYVVCGDIDLPVSIGDVGNEIIPVRIEMEGLLTMARTLRELADELEEQAHG